MSREGNLVKNTLILLTGTFLPKFASVLILPILTFCLTKEEYGAYDLVIILVSLFLPAVTLQIQTAAFRFLIEERNNGERIKIIISTIFAYIFPMSLVALMILYFFLPIDSVTIRISICAYYFVDIVVNTGRQIARGLGRNFDYSVSAVISAFGQVLFAVVFVWWLQKGLLGAIITLLGGSFLSCVILFYRLKLLSYFDISSIKLARLKQLLEYSWPMVPNSMSMWIVRLSNRLVITFFMGISWNAVYAVAYKIPSILNLAQRSFTLSWQENASIVSKDEDAAFYYSFMFKKVFDLMAGLSGLLICFTPLLFIILIKGDYEAAYNHIPILFVSQFFYALVTYLGGIYVAYMRTRSVGITTAIAAICNLIINIAAINWIGLYAASISSLISNALLFIYRAVDIQKIVQLKFDIKHMCIVFLILIIESVLCFLRIKLIDVFNIILGLSFCYVLNRVVIKMTFRKCLSFFKHD